MVEPASVVKFRIDPKPLTQGIESMDGLEIVVVPINNRESQADNVAQTINRLVGGDIAGAFRGPLRVVTGTANSYEVPFVVYFGDAEATQDIVTVRDMGMKQEYKVPLSGAPLFFVDLYKNLPNQD